MTEQKPPVKPRHCQEQFFAEFKAYMLSQLKRPGDKIETEMELAERFGVTRYRVRQALERLNQNGVLKRVKKGGSTVRALDEEEFVRQIRLQFEIAGYNEEEFINARVWLETALVLSLTEEIKPEVLANLEKIISRIEDNAAQAPVADHWLKTFHIELFNVSGNRIIKVYGTVLGAWFDATTKYVAHFPESYFLDIAGRLRQFMQAVKAGEKLQAIDIMQQMVLEKSREIEKLHRQSVQSPKEKQPLDSKSPL